MYLTELPVSAFKLDRALITGLPENKAMQSVVHSLLVLAEHLDLDVVAEGIETQAQHESLANAGCAYAQGFGFAKPMALSDLQSFMEETKQLTSRLF
jgi:sensor c-di-GMP phosphodiesterase-like protein